MAVVNESWRLCPWADLLYACDGAWWRRRNPGAAFAGLKVTQDAEAARRYGLHLIRLRQDVNRFVLDEPGVVGWGGNGGFHLLNLAVQCGARRIVLVGYDMTLAGGVHWHGRHGEGLNNPTADLLARWARRLDAQAPLLAELGVEVLNASPTSALTAFPRVDFEEVFAREANSGRRHEGAGGQPLSAAVHPRAEPAPEGVAVDALA